MKDAERELVDEITGKAELIAGMFRERDSLKLWCSELAAMLVMVVAQAGGTAPWPDGVSRASVEKAIGNKLISYGWGSHGIDVREGDKVVDAARLKTIIDVMEAY